MAVPAVKLKSPPSLTINVTFWVRVIAVPTKVAVMVMVEVASGVVLPTARVKVTFTGFPGVKLMAPAGENAQVALTGKPLQARVTEPVSAPSGVTTIVIGALAGPRGGFRSLSAPTSCQLH